MFKYKFQRLLEYQRMLEEKTREELSRHFNLLISAEKKLDRLIGVKFGYEKRLYDKQKRGEEIRTILLYLNYISKIENELYIQRQEIAKIKTNIEQIQERLLELTKKRKMLEKLEEKAKVKFIKEQEQEELKKLSEFAVHQFNKKNGKGS